VKLTSLGALGLGYVLGSRAGSERYEQIRRWTAELARRLEAYGEAGTLAARVDGDRPPGRR
jgi:hypothetical protein